MNNKHKTLFAIASVLAIASFIIAFYYWNKLPAQIPTHFGFNGEPNAWSNKSIFYVFFIPVLQVLMLGSFVFLYFKPQYSDMPTTLWLTTLPKEQKEHAFSLIRTMLAVISIWIGLLFTYITYMMNTSALQKNTGPTPWIMLVLIGGMLIWLGFYTVKVYKVTKEAIKK